MDVPNITEPTEEAPFGYHFLWYFLQLIFSAPGVVIASSPLVAVLSILGLGMKHENGDFAGYEALVCLYVGVFVGWWMAQRAPLLARSGRWIWVVPAIVILPFATAEILHPSPVPWLSDLLFGFNNGGEGIALVAFPLCSVIGYSIGMALAGVKRKLRPILLCAAVSLCILSLLLYVIERRSLARFATLRSVINNSGLQLLPDAPSLCGPQTSYRSARILSFGTMVESLGRAACDGGRLTSADSLPPPVIGRSGPYTLEHVRVLTGPSAGQEGWVMQYGVMELLNR